MNWAPLPPMPTPADWWPAELREESDGINARIAKMASARADVDADRAAVKSADLDAGTLAKAHALPVRLAGLLQEELTLRQTVSAFAQGMFRALHAAIAQAAQAVAQAGVDVRKKLVKIGYIDLPDPGAVRVPGWITPGIVQAHPSFYAARLREAELTNVAADRSLEQENNAAIRAVREELDRLHQRLAI